MTGFVVQGFSLSHTCMYSGMHRAQEVQRQNSVMRAQPWTVEGGGLIRGMFGPHRLGVGDMAKLSLFFFLERSQFYYNS